MAIHVERDDHIAIVTMDRREALNAFNTAQLQSMLDAILNLSSDAAVRAVILTGRGDRAFAVGADIREMLGKRPVEALEFSRLGHRVCRSIEEAPQPWIAAINGYAFGGGCEIALACDMRYASENAQIGQPEVTLGVTPGWGGTQRLPRLVGSGVASEIVLADRRLNAQEACDVGLVNAVTSADELLTKARETAVKIAAHAPAAVRASKRAIAVSHDVDTQNGLLFEMQSFALMFSTEDQTEGMTAFIERRAPQFTDK